MFWVTYGLPGLNIGWNTYKIIDKSILPEIEIDPKYSSYNTINDFDNNIPEIYTPTACYFAINKQDNSFYRDQQDCVIWYYKPEIGVYIDENEEIVVSNNLPEFLSRIDLESRIWFHNEAGKLLNEDEKKYVDGINIAKENI
jgi:hypothetical protein